MKHSYVLLCILVNTLCTAGIQDTFKTALRYFHQHNYSYALELFQDVLTQLPDNSGVACNTALTLTKLGRFDEALKLYEHVLAREPHNPRAQRAASHIYLRNNDFTNGWQAYEYRWKQPPHYNQELKDYVQSGKDLHGKTVLVKTEYGLGDTFHFIRYARTLKEHGAHVIVESQKPLVPLLRLCPYIDSVIPMDTPVPNTDFTVLLMSLPLVFDTQPDTIDMRVPYLHADAKLEKQWHNYFNNNHAFKIGICWHADAHTDAAEQVVKDDGHTKSIPLKFLLPLAKLNNVKLYSLQKFHGLEQLADTDVVHSFDNLDEEHGAFMDTAALINQLDLVITVDTSIAHLAGALGKPVWTLLPTHADWRWAAADTTAWYKTIRLFRQPKPGDWQSIADNVYTALAHESSWQTLFKRATNLYHNDAIENALKTYQCALATGAQHPTVFYNTACCLKVLGRYHEAINYYKKNLDHEPNNGKTCLGLAKSYLATRDFARGWPLLEHRFAHMHEYHRALNYTDLTPDDLRGKRVLLRAEWGLGDFVQFIRYAQLVKDCSAHVIVQTFPPLKDLLSRCPYIDTLITTHDPLPECDHEIPLLSLPMIFGTTPETIPADIPYIFADPMLENYWRMQFNNDKKLRVGLCWDTKKIFLEEHLHTRRSIPLQLFAPIAHLDHVSLYSLQQVNGLEQLNDLPENFELHIFDETFDQKHGRFMDTAAVIKNLDLVITADTSIVHVAAALGAHVWVLLPYAGEWRWELTPHGSPWYPDNVRLFRQREPGNWHHVIKEVKEALSIYA